MFESFENNLSLTDDLSAKHHVQTIRQQLGAEWLVAANQQRPVDGGRSVSSKQEPEIESDIQTQDVYGNGNKKLKRQSSIASDIEVIEKHQNQQTLPDVEDPHHNKSELLQLLRAIKILLCTGSYVSDL